MKKKLIPVVKANLKLLPNECQGCNFWQSGSRSGKILLADNQSVGYANYAAASLFPRLRSLPLSPGSLDTIFIACFYITENYRRQGLGKYFLNCLQQDLIKQGYKTIETIVKRYPKKSPAGWVEFYEACGFRPIRQINDLVLMRLDMRSIASWANKVGNIQWGQAPSQGLITGMSPMIKM